MKDLLEEIKTEEGVKKYKYEGKQRVFYYMKMFYGLFLIWLGINIINNDELHVLYSKYLKETFEFVKTFIDKYNPNLVSKLFDFNILTGNIEAIIYYFSIILMVGGGLLSVGWKLGKIIVFILIFLDIVLVHNVIYFKEEKLKVNVIKFISFFGGIYYL